MRPGGGGRAGRAGEPAGVLWARLTERDRRVLHLVDVHRVLTTDQLLAMEFDSRTRAQHRLVELYRLRVLWRFRFPLVEGGSQPWHYTLGYAGARLIAAQKAVRPPRPAEHAERLERLVESPRLRHQLGVNDLFTSLAGHARRAGWPSPNVLDGSGLDTWRSEAEITELHKHLVRPDGYGCWAEPGRQRLGFYLEHDTGTETLATVVKKLDDYTAAQEWAQPRLFGMVLFSVATARREAGLRAALAAKHCPIPIATTAREHGHPDGPAGPVWAVVGDGSRPVPRARLGQLPQLIGGTNDSGRPVVLVQGCRDDSDIVAHDRFERSTTTPELSIDGLFDDPDSEVLLYPEGDSDSW